ncbi:MAG: Uma2 family endonuclease [Bacillaceae bacterium]|nr:Uma2 family endonuclease [Bacillaceae bacterium]
MEKKRKKDEVKEEGLTYEDYANLPDDGQRYELVNGTLEMLAPAPSSEHQVISNNLSAVINQSCRFDYFILDAPIDLILSNHEVRQPDLVMIHMERRHIITRRGIEGAPDLVVEILSPSTAMNDKKSKWETYARFGVNEYWIVDPVHRTVEQHVLHGEKSKYDLNEVYGKEEDTITSPHISCLSIPVKEVFLHLDLLELD